MNNTQIIETFKNLLLMILIYWILEDCHLYNNTLNSLMFMEV